MAHSESLKEAPLESAELPPTTSPRGPIPPAPNPGPIPGRTRAPAGAPEGSTAPLAPRPSTPALVRRALPAILLASRGIVTLVGKLPRPVGLAVTGAISRPLRRLTWERCRGNIDAFFTPLGWSLEERTRLFLAHQRYMVRMRFEAARLLCGPREEIDELVEITGEEHIRAAQSEGRGVLLVGGHEGTWWHTAILLAHRGHDVRSVFNSFPGKRTDDYLVSRARRHDVRLSMVDRGAAEQFKACARENALFYITFDVAIRPLLATPQPFGPVRLPVERAPAILATRLGMPVLQVECEHLPGERARIRILPPKTLGRERAGRGAALCQAWSQGLAERILARPEQWWGWGFVDLLPALVPTPPAASGSTTGTAKSSPANRPG